MVRVNPPRLRDVIQLASAAAMHTAECTTCRTGAICSLGVRLANSADEAHESPADGRTGAVGEPQLVQLMDGPELPQDHPLQVALAEIPVPVPCSESCSHCNGGR